MGTSDVPYTKEITAFIHCSSCLPLKPDNVSPQEYAMFDVGWTKWGIQVWCLRCDVNVLHMDFEGTKHPAIISTPLTIDQSLQKISGLLDHACQDTSMKPIILREVVKHLSRINAMPGLSRTHEDEANRLGQRLAVLLDNS